MRSVRMPWPMATLLISRVFEREMMSLRISSLDRHGFDDGQPAGVAGVLAAITAATAIQRDAVKQCSGQCSGPGYIFCG